MKVLYNMILMLCIASISLLSCEGQVNATKTDTVKIYGNCSMCKKNIEKAGTLKKTAKVDWDKNTKLATIAYDESKTSIDEILKKIAGAGYDSDKFRADDKVYENLHGCCQYDRPEKE